MHGGCSYKKSDLYFIRSAADPPPSLHIGYTFPFQKSSVRHNLHSVTIAISPAPLIQTTPRRRRNVNVILIPMQAIPMQITLMEFVICGGGRRASCEKRAAQSCSPMTQGALSASRLSCSFRFHLAGHFINSHLLLTLSHPAYLSPFHLP